MDGDKILESLGRFGLFQVLFFLCVSFIYMRGAWPVMAILFLGGDPGHHCKVPVNESVAVIIPVDSNGDFEKCVMKSLTQNQTKSCDQGWTYGSEFDSTILTEWDLVCDNNFLVDLSSTIYMVGNTLGALFLTPLSDKFGRKWVILGMLWIQGAIGIGTAFASSYAMFTVLRFFIALLNMPIALTTYVMVTEMFPASNRSFPSVGINCSWGIGLVVLAVMGYFIRDWRTLQLVISVPNFLTIIYAWFLPESIRWLIAKKKYNQAKTVAKFAAKVNNKEIPAELLAIQEQEPMETSGVGQSQVGLLRSKDTRKYTVLDLFKTSKLRRYTLIMFYLWTADSVCYFGILFATPQLHGNQFLNLGISGIVEIPALIICMFIINWVGRRRPVIFFLLLSGIMNIITIFIPNKTDSGVDLGWLQITAAMIGKFGITGAYSLSYLYSSEIFPTVVRNHALGLSSFFENLGGIAAPLIVYATSSTQSYIPLVVFGVIMVVGGILACFLPETHKKPLPETIEDVEHFTRGAATQTENTYL
ncbi:organic anion transporter 3-like [Saccostrea echinata]|uniref:organic anion transporter 3-like n=1 Tax=Saccostrea echinata TaxID=191078 RepID=UPI002A801C98|nr:organic anion transporter 3-like [Saccostrea echinata]XP_061167208.1 organic anion transporter 3-like [Saccostrea echinata]